MDEFPKEERDRIIAALDKKNATRPCPRCGNESFAIISGYFAHFVQPRLGAVAFGGPSIPTAVVTCTNCGWLAEHALGTLGLLPPAEGKQEKGP